MTTIRISATCSLPPEHVLHAACDFTAQRVQVWPAVRAEHFAVHDQSDTTADVTEGTPAGIGINWGLFRVFRGRRSCSGIITFATIS